LLKTFYRWATTPPQAYIVYLVLILAVGSLSFMAGRLKPKATSAVVPQSTSMPRN